ncbi:MAG TPA: S9 family peptidase [Candidatus Krumholzibacteria bacterium]|nr:S9 family peptidase [Candidatus Krumholzibacteria bacterium]
MIRVARSLALAAVLAATLTALGALPTLGEPPPLVPRALFLGNPVKTGATVSPDGKRLAYLAPSDKGVLNVWIRTVGGKDDRMVTQDEKRPIRTHFWAEDGRHLLYMQDVAGKENFHLHAVDVEKGGTRDLTPFEGVRATNPEMQREHPNEVLVGLNKRDKHFFDMHRLDLTTGEVKLDTENPGDVESWVVDAGFVVRGALAQNQSDGRHIIRVRDTANSPWRDLLSAPNDDVLEPVDFSADGKSLFVETSLGTDTNRLVRVDLATGKEVEVLATDRRCDVGPFFVQPDRHVVQAVGCNYTRLEWKVLDPSVQDDFAGLKKVRDGDFIISGRDRADKTWIVRYTLDDGPVAFYAWDRTAKKATFLFVIQPELEKVKLSKMEPVVIPARDGLPLVCYLTKPLGGATEKLPMVLYVHGGPWGRDTWGYNSAVQWLANRGYAVLQVNFRASTGFGKKFVSAGNLQWGGAMQDDLSDAVAWATKQGIADPQRIAIMGGSYGGYATLAGLTFTPELYACGVDIVGPSNLKTLLGAIPPYWATDRKTFELRMGAVDRDSLLNQKMSPLFHVDKIRSPLLVGQGLNDPRVNVRESDQIVAAMRAKGLPVEYVVYTDEGHGFARQENRLDFYGRAEVFLAKYLGGRAEPFTPVPGASAEVREPVTTPQASAGR